MIATAFRVLWAVLQTLWHLLWLVKRLRACNVCR
jgi:hypothetical protein